LAFPAEQRSLCFLGDLEGVMELALLVVVLIAAGVIIPGDPHILFFR
jgi:hypothetical protein